MRRLLSPEALVRMKGTSMGIRCGRRPDLPTGKTLTLRRTHVRKCTSWAGPESANVGPASVEAAATRRREHASALARRSASADDLDGDRELDVGMQLGRDLVRPYRLDRLV